MNRDPRASRILVPALLAVLLLPYATPAICGIIGRMRVAVTGMPEGCTLAASASVSTGSWNNAAAPGGGHCNFAQCSSTVVAPVTLAFSVVPISLVVQQQLLPPKARALELSLSPPTPPPQA